MPKGTSIKEAINRWEKKHQGQNIAEALEVGFQFQWPPITEMDKDLSRLTNCQKLSLSTNMIEKISGLHDLKNLKILSLGRNNIKSLVGLEPVGETLEQLWISYNFIEKTAPVTTLKKLKVLYMAYNKISDWAEFGNLQECKELEDLQIMGNPIIEGNEETYVTVVRKRMPYLRVLDGRQLVKDDAS